MLWLHYLYTFAHCSLSVCIHTCMTSIMLRPLASHTHTTVPVACVHTSTLVLLPRLSFSLYVDTTYLYTYIVCALVYYPVHAPYHNILYHSIGILPPLTRLHVRIYLHIPIHLSIDRYTISHMVYRYMVSSHHRNCVLKSKNCFIS